MSINNIERFTIMIKEVVGYAGNYEVSSCGKVFSKGIPLKQETNSGYRRVSLSLGGISRHLRVHRLVAGAFIPNPFNLPQVNHIDEDKSNNEVSNLEWCTVQKNCEHSKAKYYSLVSPLGERVSIYNLAKYCRENGLNKSHMLSVSKGLRLSHKGWTS